MSRYRGRRVEVAVVVGALIAELIVIRAGLLMPRLHRRPIVVRRCIHVGRHTIGMRRLRMVAAVRLRLMRIVLAVIMILRSRNDRCREEGETDQARRQLFSEIFSIPHNRYLHLKREH